MDKEHEHYGSCGECGVELTETFAAALSDDGWTYCDERLPEEDDEFLVLYDFGDDSTGPFHSTAEFFAEGEDPAGWLVHRATNPTARVIAYRPLEPAKGRDAIESCSRCGSSVCHPLCDCWKCK